MIYIPVYGIFWFLCIPPGETAEIQFTVNVSDVGGAAIYLFLDEDWQEAKETTNCLHKLQMARLHS